jgi:hypothetical protein
MHIGGGRFHRVDDTYLAIHPDVDLHPEIPLVAFPSLVHLGISLCLLILGRAWSRDDGGIVDRSLPYGHSVGFEMNLHRLENLRDEIVFLQQMPKRQDSCLIGDPVGDQGDAGKATHGRYLDQRILHRRIDQVVPLLHQMNPQRGLKRRGRPTTLTADLGVVGLDQIDQRIPRHNSLHLAQKSLAPGPLFRRGLLVITKAELFDAHESYPRPQSHRHSRAGWWGFPESP